MNTLAEKVDLLTQRIEKLEKLLSEDLAFPRKCPSCGNGAIAETLLGWNKGPNPNTRRCLKCGHSWRHGAFAK